MNELANLAAGSTPGGPVGGARLLLLCFVFGLLKYTFSLFFHLASFLCAAFYLAVSMRLAWRTP